MNINKLAALFVLTLLSYSIWAQTNDTTMTKKINKTEEQWKQELGEEKISDPKAMWYRTSFYG